MRIAILESIIMPAGHEVEFDRILVDELKRQGHEVVFFVPKNFHFKLDYETPVVYLDGGEVISYAGVSKWKKPFLSILREKRRREWFNSAAKNIKEHHIDILIIPTASFRYIKAVMDTNLKDIDIPIHLIFHGIMSHEIERFQKHARKTKAYSNILLDVISMREDFLLPDQSNLKRIPPPVYLPKHNAKDSQNEILILGFLGQFRKEKNIVPLLEAFVTATFVGPVQLLVQGATTTDEDANLFESIIKDYSQYESIIFLHKNLIGSEWEVALQSVDAILIPYGAERYRYQPSAMLFTALGFKKPVLVSPEINPEVVSFYRVGEVVNISSVDTIRKGLESFVNTMINKPEVYEEGLLLANQAFSHEAFVRSILGEPIYENFNG